MIPDGMNRMPDTILSTDKVSHLYGHQTSFHFTSRFHFIHNITSHIMSFIRVQGHETTFHLTSQYYPP